MAKQTTKKTKNPLSLGLADVKAASGFFELEPGRYVLEFVDVPKFTPADEETEQSARMSFRFEVISSDAEDGEDYTGRYWTHTFFIPNEPREDADEDEYERIQAWRNQVLSRIKSIFDAAGVEVTKDKAGNDVYDEEEFLGKKVFVNCRYAIDRNTGEPRLSSSGNPIKNYYFRRYSGSDE